MTEWIDWLSQYAFEGGMGGLFVLSVLDSVGVPTGGGSDIVIALLASLHPETSFALGLVISGVVGSLMGCSVLYWIGLRGGELGARRFAPNAVTSTRAKLERHGAWVLFLAILARPPIPTKLFIFCAGVGALPLLLLRFFALRWWRQQSAID
ncbi:MAG TPA: hypothetical protein DIC52_21095 [Candidatus Latescibacteria bacterium]|nr:hypothetical protein [Candidatus Latescibacterota bacterium]